MEKLIELLWEWKPNFDDNNILDYMYSDGTIFIKDGKPVYAYDELISPNVERMIINKKEGFIERLLDKEKIDRDELYDEMEGVVYYNYYEQEVLEEYSDSDGLIMLLSVQENPITFILKHLK